MVNEAIAKVIADAERAGLIKSCERVWAVNRILDVLGLDSWEDPGKDWETSELAPLLDELLDDAYERGG